MERQLLLELVLLTKMRDLRHFDSGEYKYSRFQISKEEEEEEQRESLCRLELDSADVSRSEIF